MARKTRGLRGAAVATLLALPPTGGWAQTLEIATDQSPVGLDPHVATSFATVLVDGLVYEGLTDVDKDLRVVPGLAESWTVSAAGRVYSFKLRERSDEGRGGEAC